MKNVILFLIVLCSFSAFAQKDKKPKYDNDGYVTDEKEGIDLQAPKKTWKIIVHNNLSADANFTLVGRTLIDNNYTIQIKDKEFYSIQTAPTDVSKKLPGSHFLIFSIKDSTIAVTGKFILNMSIGLYGAKTEPGYSKISNFGMKGSIAKESFLKMYSFGKLLGNNLTYISE